MTTPTPAQIEAARKMLQLSSCFGWEVCTLMPCACAETMAAQYTAAIERCAEVAEGFSFNTNKERQDIAAAIRALKDKP